MPNAFLGVSQAQLSRSTPSLAVIVWATAVAMCVLVVHEDMMDNVHDEGARNVHEHHVLSSCFVSRQLLQSGRSHHKEAEAQQKP